MKIIKLIFMVIFLTGLCLQAEAQDKSQYDIGLRGSFSTAQGPELNDRIGGGVYGHYKLSDNTSLGFGLDYAKFDFENPAKALKLNKNDKHAIDAKATSYAISCWYEKEYSFKESRSWFWTLGGGLEKADVPDAVGDLAGGGKYTIKTKTNPELFATAGLGLKFNLNFYPIG